MPPANKKCINTEKQSENNLLSLIRITFLLLLVSEIPEQKMFFSCPYQKL